MIPAPKDLVDTFRKTISLQELCCKNSQKSAILFQSTTFQDQIDHWKLSFMELLNARMTFLLPSVESEKLISPRNIKLNKWGKSWEPLKKGTRSQTFWFEVWSGHFVHILWWRISPRDLVGLLPNWKCTDKKSDLFIYLVIWSGQFVEIWQFHSWRNSFYHSTR